MNQIVFICVLALIVVLVLGAIWLQNYNFKSFLGSTDMSSENLSSENPGPAKIRNCTESNSAIVVAIELCKLLKIKVDIKSKSRKE